MLSSARLYLYRVIAPVMPSRMFGIRAKMLRWAGAEIGEYSRTQPITCGKRRFLNSRGAV